MSKDTRMRNKTFSKIVTAGLLSSAAFSTFAWNHGISLGYGGGSDIRHHTDTNSGAFLSGEITSIKQKDWVNITLNGSLGQFYSSWIANKDLFTAAASVAFRFYPVQMAYTHPFFLASIGPAYLSNTQFGRNTQAANFALQSIVGAGLEFGKAKRVDLNMRLIHYSNAYTMHPNEGFNIFYVVSLGYLF